ncbi:sensor histidine kinase [Sphaerisporangium perillae]|uniref:sensor histidine kinase n=1 Tax=Sphaerisporangium perillae TaxID=2935860 RepID=UPI00200DB54C|nr:histidine kinase [Sphaerisporangium perillae]
MRDNGRLVHWIQRLSDISLVGFLGLLLLADTALAVSIRGAQWAVPFCGLIGIGAYLLRRRFRVQGAVLLMTMSAAVSLAIAGVGSNGAPGFAETGALLLITVGVLRWVRPLRTAVLLSVLSMITLELGSVRPLDPSSIAFGFLMFVAWAVAMGIGSYLRYQLERRQETVDAVRRAERLELARELHDLVAHHITGIVVQAQAARTVAVHQPEAVLPSLDAIAGAGADALTSMRRLVGVLRAEDDASRNAGTTLADLRVLVERFSAGGPPVAFDVGQGLSELALAPEVLTTLHRILQESLTNVRRHAPHAAWVMADLRPADRGVLLRVRNHRTSADPRLSRMGGGFGLVGMAERVQALGGDLLAGPTRDGEWEVRAWFPVDRAITSS